MTAALTADHVRLSFGDKVALDDFNLTAEPGRVTALLGPNGAGKTTFIRCCTSLLTPDEGSVKIFGHRPGSPEARAHVGLMPQSTGAWSSTTAARLLPYLASLYANPQPVDALMQLLEIDEFANTTYRSLSGGQQQRVNLAGALVGRPALVFLDEPTAGLDPRARQDTWQLIRRIRDDGVAVLLTTHNMQEAESLADEVAIVHRGRVRATGSVATVAAGGSLEDAFLMHTEE